MNITRVAKHASQSCRDCGSCLGGSPLCTYIQIIYPDQATEVITNNPNQHPKRCIEPNGYSILVDSKAPPCSRLRSEQLRVLAKASSAPDAISVHLWLFIDDH